MVSKYQSNELLGHQLVLKLLLWLLLMDLHNPVFSSSSASICSELYFVSSVSLCGSENLNSLTSPSHCSSWPSGNSIFLCRVLDLFDLSFKTMNTGKFVIGLSNHYIDIFFPFFLDFMFPFKSFLSH